MAIEIEFNETQSKEALPTHDDFDKSGNFDESGNGTPREAGNKEENDSQAQGSGETQQSMNINDYNEGDKFYGTIKSNPIFNKATNKKEIIIAKAIWTILKKMQDVGQTYKVRNARGDEYFVKKSNIEIEDLQEALNIKKQREEEAKQREEEAKKEAEFQAKMFNFSSLNYADQLFHTVNAGINNIWMVGPAGCGKSTMAMNLAKELKVPYYVISCGIGTSAAEFVGYKYPQREPTKFAEYYQKPSVILIDEMTALDPAVAQVLNAALANDAIETTTGNIKRDENCIIIATSNTFGTGADRQYVANNQLDASTIDRFVGGIIEVDYSAEYESRYDKECIEYVQLLRGVIKENDLRRVASTRTLQRCTQLKNHFFRDWRERMIVNWTKAERTLVEHAMVLRLKQRVENVRADKYKIKSVAT